MKLQNITASWFVAALLLLISIWAAIFYYAMLDEIYDSIDDGLDNQKQLIIQRAISDTSIFLNTDFNEGGYTINEIPAAGGIEFVDEYIDTTMYMLNEDDFEPVRLLTTVFTHRGKYYKLKVATSMVEEDDLVAELLYSLLWLSLGLILSILILNKILLARIWKSFYRLLDQLKRFKLDSQDEISFSKTRIEEFRLLNESIRTLLERNKATFNSQKQFIENAAHELQTPLAISINKLEALAGKNRFTPEEYHLLEGALDNLERMTRLNKALLLLTRIENKQYAQVEPINMNRLIRKLSEDFSEQAGFSEISIEINDHDESIIKMDPNLADIMISNLVRNAVIHNKPGGFLHINIHKEMIIFENTGDNEPLDPEIIFTRFYKKHPSSSSTGLGLSILRAIANLHGFTVQYEFNGNHRFLLKF